MQASYAKKISWLLLISSLIKLLAAPTLELGNDEVYYWTYAIQPDWSHFDHPPMVGWLMRFTTFNLHWANEVTIRSGSIICAAISTWLLFKLGKLLANEQAGWYAALIYQCSVYTGFIAGFFILPDSPQMPFWTGALYLMCRILFAEEEKKTRQWLLLGLLIGLATLCKVHALYLWAGFGLFILVNRIKWLSNWRLYAGVMVTLVCLFPIVYWNILNDFITYRYHSNRVTHTTIQCDMLLREIVGEFAYQNPVIFIGIIIAIIALLRKKINCSKEKITWLLCMSVPMILMFWGISLLNPTLPHWSGPGYIPLMMIAAIYYSQKTTSGIPILIKSAAVLILTVLATGILLINFSPINYGSSDVANFGEYSPVLDLSGWKNLADSFSLQVKNDEQEGRMKNKAPIITNKWFPGGHIEFYISPITGQQLLGIGALDDLHKFAWLNKDRKQLALGDDAYCIIPSNLPMDVASAYGQYFTFIESPVIYTQKRGEDIIRYFYVYRLKGCKQVPPTVLK